ncbi:hypothetical protein [Streptomyces sp. NBC_00344]|uniref:hypothetical protein n=1 Tax=Streptomyces sp. NBC_00344 TaxID=2975720 RepID=UPI002E20A8FC
MFISEFTTQIHEALRKTREFVSGEQRNATFGDVSDIEHLKRRSVGKRCIDTSQEVHIRQRQKPGRIPAEECPLRGSTASPGGQECLAASEGDVYELDRKNLRQQQGY